MGRVDEILAHEDAMEEAMQVCEWVSYVRNVEFVDLEREKSVMARDDRGSHELMALRDATYEQWRAVDAALLAGHSVYVVAEVAEVSREVVAECARFLGVEDE